MKKILVTRKLLQSNEDRLKETYDVYLNTNDELYSQNKLIELSQGCDGILSALTDKLDLETINKLPDTFTSPCISNSGPNIELILLFLLFV